MKCQNKRCPNPAAPGVVRCAEHHAAKMATQHAARDKAMATREAFFAKHRSVVAPVTAPPVTDRISAKHLAGRTFGMCEVQHHLTGKMWRCKCLACGAAFDEPSDRIMLGSSARHGCGCARRRAPAPPGPMPRHAGITAERVVRR